MNPAAANARVDLPAPVRPATPTCSPARTATVTSSTAATFRPGYRITSLSIDNRVGAAGSTESIVAP